MKKFFAVAVVLAAAIALAVPAWAANVKVGGRMLTDTGWWNRSKELTTSGDDVGTIFLDLNGISYLRAVFTSADKTTGGRIELGLKSVHASATTSLRYAYGWWKVGNCTLLAGQTDNWFGSAAFAPKQMVGLAHNAHLLLLGWGFLWPHRVPQVSLTWASGAYGLQIALEEPRSTRLSTEWGSNTTYDSYYNFPRISVTGKFKSGGFMTMPGLSLAVKYAKGLPSGYDDSYTVWAFVLPIKFTTGPFTVKFQGHYGQNFGAEYPFYPTSTGPALVGGKMKDTTCWGGAIGLEYKLGALALVGGAGYEKFENSDWKSGLGYAKDNTSRWSVFVGAPYSVTKNFTVHPELAYYNHGDNPATGSDAGNEWILGLQLKFVF